MLLSPSSSKPPAAKPVAIVKYLNEIHGLVTKVKEAKENSDFILGNKKAIEIAANLEQALKQKIQALDKIIRTGLFDCKDCKTVTYQISDFIHMLNFDNRIALMGLLFSIASKVDLKKVPDTITNTVVANALLNERLYIASTTLMADRLVEIKQLLVQDLPNARSDWVRQQYIELLYFKKKAYFDTLSKMELELDQKGIDQLNTQLIIDFMARFDPIAASEIIRWVHFYKHVYDMFTCLVKRNPRLNESHFKECKDKRLYGFVEYIRRTTAISTKETYDAVQSATDLPNDLADLIASYSIDFIQPLKEPTKTFPKPNNSTSFRTRFNFKTRLDYILQDLCAKLTLIKEFEFDEFGMHTFDRYNAELKELCDLLEKADIIIEKYQENNVTLECLPPLAQTLYNSFLDIHTQLNQDHIRLPMYCLLPKVAAIVGTSAKYKEPVHTSINGFNHLLDLMRDPSENVEHTLYYQDYPEHGNKMTYTFRLQMICDYLLSIQPDQLPRNIMKSISDAVVLQLEKNKYEPGNGNAFVLLNIAYLLIAKKREIAPLDTFNAYSMLPRSATLLAVEQRLNSARTGPIDVIAIKQQIENFFTAILGPYRIPRNKSALLAESAVSSSSSASYSPGYAAAISSSSSSSSSACFGSSSSSCMSFSASASASSSAAAASSVESSSSSQDDEGSIASRCKGRKRQKTRK